MTPEEFKEAIRYQSPIEVIQGEITAKIEGEIMTAIQHYDIRVDKEELIKALQYDRKQYEKGYQDAKEDYQKPEDEWVPIKFRPLTEEEKERYPEETDGIYDCRLPDDGEEVLITTRWGAVCIDTFQKEGDTCYFEDHDDAKGNKVCMFLKLTFLEGQRRRWLFENYPPKTVWVSSGRIKCGTNGNFEGCSSMMAQAWYIWEKGYTGETTLRWFN